MARNCKDEREEPSNGERERERESVRDRVIVRECERGRKRA